MERQQGGGVREIQEGRDVYICIVDSLDCIAKTKATL